MTFVFVWSPGVHVCVDSTSVIMPVGVLPEPLLIPDLGQEGESQWVHTAHISLPPPGGARPGQMDVYPHLPQRMLGVGSFAL